MAQQPDISGKTEAKLGKPELSLSAASGTGPDPRLVSLARLLARRAARGLYEQQKDRSAPRA
ncbi:hypothetical protein [Paracoccus onubensis]|uniref:Uncharacterized protein n=1 Tax=Paracoccus onubensis TaxID=1675788 RepID=A0A418T1M1_9RHOB|nr:hypothetical protein [Paracoccus onubensis]RJE87097.1 hypothetical protein D3P04_04915 [Paracoccus onubensis]